MTQRAVATLSLLGSLVFLVSCATQRTAPAPAAPTAAEVAKNYRQLRQMTAEEVDVDPELASLCVGANVDNVEAARTKSGVHVNTRILIFMNSQASQAFLSNARGYPVGSIIVKEKHGREYRDARNEWRSTPDGVGGMIKRPAGFDPDHGDWQYFYFTSQQTIETGALSSCVGCHQAAANRDHVFGTWANPSY